MCEAQWRGVQYPENKSHSWELDREGHPPVCPGFPGSRGLRVRCLLFCGVPPTPSAGDTKFSPAAASVNVILATGTCCCLRILLKSSILDHGVCWAVDSVMSVPKHCGCPWVWLPRKLCRNSNNKLQQSLATTQGPYSTWGPREGRWRVSESTQVICPLHPSSPTRRPGHKPSNPELPRRKYPAQTPGAWKPSASPFKLNILILRLSTHSLCTRPRGTAWSLQIISGLLIVPAMMRVDAWTAWENSMRKNEEQEKSLRGV